ncbi:hypothetical protein EUGRSUZ_B02067 [Eucalyptus grandis]|uniref:Uncharacterized protein n=2 Tax=Eucalyptus grandis TaxID=71139 RepID=A0ACC3M1L2_EUCGR|nr:hypothetical protein EUGRSUZ_B02067 [Eucalyptus grandis]
MQGLRHHPSQDKQVYPFRGRGLPSFAHETTHCGPARNRNIPHRNRPFFSQAEELLSTCLTSTLTPMLPLSFLNYKFWFSI